MTQYDAAVAELTGWAPPTRQQAGLRTSYLALLKDRADGLSRGCQPDHLTASVLVVNEARDRVLLNLHGRFRIWVQFGGHIDPGDLTLADAAMREGEEESGIPGLRLLDTGPVQLSRHQVECGPLRPAHHLDVRYLAVAPEGAEPLKSAESLDVRWFDVEALPAGLEPEVRDLVATAIALTPRSDV